MATATHRVVNGVRVPLSDGERAAIEVEWAANMPRPRRRRLLSAVRADVNALAPAEFQTLLREIVARLVHAGTVRVAAVAGDEPDDVLG